MPWLRLIRWKNLSIILFTQFLAWYCVILPVAPVILDLFNFLLIAISTLLIAASGYIINDYFDIKIDSINRPKKVVLGNKIALKTAIIIHSLLNFIALVLAIYVAYIQHNPFIPFLQLTCTFLLWYYSTRFKREYMIGNVVVSLLTALTIITLILYEPRMLAMAKLPFFILTTGRSSLPFWVLVVYAYFAFMLNWMREIVKDMEDFIGDAKEGCKTMPILKGLKFSTNFVCWLAILVVLPLITACVLLYKHHYFLFSTYVLFLLVLPIIGWSLHLRKGYDTNHFKKSSRGLKIIMIFGIISLIIYYL